MAEPRKPTLCKIDGCGRRSRSRLLCLTHLKQWQRTGDPIARRLPRGTPEERFWRKVDRSDPDGCWLWTGSVNKRGYGMFHRDAGSLKLAHRFAFELLVGPIPPEMQIDHVHDRGCTNRNCVNPAHLEPVTQAENTRRAWEVRRRLAS